MDTYFVTDTKWFICEGNWNVADESSNVQPNKYRSSSLDWDQFKRFTCNSNILVILTWSLWKNHIEAFVILWVFLKVSIFDGLILSRRFTCISNFKSVGMINSTTIFFSLNGFYSIYLTFIFVNDYISKNF